MDTDVVQDVLSIPLMPVALHVQVKFEFSA